MDILDAPLQDEIKPTSIVSTRTYPDDNTIDSMAKILTKAKNPLIIIGDGITHSGAQNELTKLAEIIGAQVWGADSSEVNMPASHPLNMGALGHMFGESSNPKISNADAVLICGTYVLPEVFPTLGNIFNEDAQVIHIDLNVYEIAKNHPVDIGVSSDPKLSLDRLYQYLEKTMTSNELSDARSRLKNHVYQRNELLMKNQENDEFNENSIPMYPTQFIKILSEHITKETIIFDEALTNSYAVTRYIPADKPGTFFQTRGGSLGVGIPGALGIKLVEPDKDVICFTGDGGSMYTIQALWTAVHYGINIKIVICNNGSYSLLKSNINQYWKERNIEKHNYPRSFELDNPTINFSELASSFGVSSIKVERPEDIKPAILKMMNSKGSYLVDLILVDSANI
jgi:benzoylformate decarboxylase